VGPPAKLLWESLRLAPSTSRHDKCHGSIHGNVQNWRTSLVGGFNPSEKYWSKWESSPNRGENKKYLKPPPRSPMSFAKKTCGFENFMKKPGVCHGHPTNIQGARRWWEILFEFGNSPNLMNRKFGASKLEESVNWLEFYSFSAASVASLDCLDLESQWRVH